PTPPTLHPFPTRRSSDLDRRRKNYATLHKWFRFVLRFAVAAQMLYFGMVKVIPTQFPAPSLVTLIAPVGNLSLQGLLWTSIGARSEEHTSELQSPDHLVC